MTKNSENLANLLNFLQIKDAFFFGSEKFLIDLTNLFPFTDIITFDENTEINQLSFTGHENIQIIFMKETELIRRITDTRNKVILCTKYFNKATKITREILVNIYENHFKLNIPCDIKTQIEELNTPESVYSTLMKIKFNDGIYNPKHSYVIYNREHPITFFINKMNTITANSKKNNLLILLAKILHEDFLTTGNITLTSYYKLLEQMINK